jgi:hypothetical protein
MRSILAFVCILPVFPMRVSRAEAYFLISFDEHMQWASIQDKSILTAAQIAARGMAAPPPPPLGWRVGTAVWAPRTLFLSIVAPCTDPMRFRIRNLNEAVWAS